MGHRDWLFSDAGVMQEECVGAGVHRSHGGWVGWGGAEGSVTDSHLVPVARAARVVPLSAVAFDGLSCRSNFYLKSESLKVVIQ